MKSNNFIFLLILIIVSVINMNAQTTLCNFENKSEILTAHPVTVLPDTSVVKRDYSYVNSEPPTEERDRFIYWMHGLGGDKHSWEQAALSVDNGNAVFPARKTLSERIEYAQSGDLGIQDEAKVVKNDMIKYANSQQMTEAERENAIIISHSQGGILTRALNKEMEDDRKYFGGFITFNTSNGGAQILNSAKDGAGDDFAEFATSRLAGPVIAEGITSFWLINLFLSVDDITERVDSLATNFLAPLANKLLAGISDQLQTEDYKMGAQWLQDIRQYEEDPARQFRPARVAFYNKEHDEGYLIWRTLHYQAQSPNRFSNFGANMDSGPETLKWDIDSLHTFYEDKYDFFANTFDEHDCTTILNDVLQWGFNWATSCDRWGDLRDRYEQSLQFFIQANSRWKFIIGATEIIQLPGCRVSGQQNDVDQNNNPVTVQYRMDFPDIVTMVGCQAQAQTMLTWPDILSADPEMVPTDHIISKPSDGVVLSESQMALPAYTHKPEYLEGSSHMQIRNDDNTKNSLNRIFEGEVGDFFITAKREP